VVTSVKQKSAYQGAFFYGGDKPWVCCDQNIKQQTTKLH